MQIENLQIMRMDYKVDIFEKASKGRKSRQGLQQLRHDVTRATHFW